MNQGLWLESMGLNARLEVFLFKQIRHFAKVQIWLQRKDSNQKLIDLLIKSKWEIYSNLCVYKKKNMVIINP